MLRVLILLIALAGTAAAQPARNPFECGVEQEALADSLRDFQVLPSAALSDGDVIDPMVMAPETRRLALVHGGHRVFGFDVAYLEVSRNAEVTRLTAHVRARWEVVRAAARRTRPGLWLCQSFDCSTGEAPTLRIHAPAQGDPDVFPTVITCNYVDRALRPRV